MDGGQKRLVSFRGHFHQGVIYREQEISFISEGRPIPGGSLAVVPGDGAEFRLVAALPEIRIIESLDAFRMKMCLRV